MVELNPCRNLTARRRAGCCLAMTETFSGRKPVWAILIRVFLAAALALPALGASAGVVLTSLHSFQVFTSGGAYPSAGLVQGSDGNFYGTTTYGGASIFYGTLIKITANGTLTNLHSFANGTDGGVPYGGLVQGRDGNFYGTTLNGGTNGVGVVFKLTVPLGPPPYPINQITGVQLSGTDIVFRIPSIAGETYQLQFSNSINPTNWSNIDNVSVTNSIGALLTLTNVGGALPPQGFYRFDITP